MSNNRPRREWDRNGKPDAIVDVLTYIMSEQTFPEGQQCVDSDSYARQLFEDPRWGNINVPNNVRLVFVNIGDRDKKERGSVVIELPDPSSPALTRPDIMRYPAELMNQPRDWDTLGKCAAITDVILHIMSHPQVGQFCLTSDSYVRNLFMEVGNLKIPPDVKAIFVPPGEKESEEFGSLIIERPPLGPIPSHQDINAPHPLLEYVLCCYTLWAG